MKFLPGEEFLPGWEPLGYTILEATKSIQTTVRLLYTFRD